MLLFIEARHNIYRCNQQCGSDTNALDKLSTASKDAIIKLVSPMMLTDLDISSAVELISNGPLHDVDKSQLVSFMSTKVGTGENVVNDRRRSLQDAELITSYFTQVEWSTVLKPDMPLQPKLELIAHRSIRLGFCNPSERSFASMVSIAMHGCPYFASTSLANVRLLKRLHRSVTAKMQPLAMPPQSLPVDVGEFKEQYPMLFAATFPDQDHQPVPPPGGASQWAVAGNMIACRSTRTGCSEKTQAMKTTQSDSVVQGLLDIITSSRGRSSSGDIPIAFNKHVAHRVDGHPMLALQPVRNPPEMLALPPIPEAANASPTATSLADSFEESGQASPASTVAAPPVQQTAVAAPQAQQTAVAAPPIPQTAVGASVSAMVEAMRAQMQQPAMKKPAAATPASTSSSSTPAVASTETQSPMKKNTNAKPVANKPKTKAKATKATSEPVKLKQNTAPMKRPAAQQTWGCSRCRMKPHGCSQCWDPAFGGRRA